MFCQRVGTQQQVLYVLEVTASFRQAVDRGGWAKVRHGGFRAELLKGRRERIATAVAATAAITTTWNATAHQGFSKTLGRINATIRIIFRTNLLGQRIAGGEHVVDVHVGTAGFVETVDWRFRAQLLFAGFRAKLRKQLVRTGQTAITTGQVATAANGFGKAGRGINRAIRRRFRTQLLGQRVGATDHVADVLEVTGRFLQTGRREGGATVKGAVGIVDEILIQHFTIERQRGIEYLCRFRAELLYYRIQRQLVAGIFLGSVFAFIQTGFRIDGTVFPGIAGRTGTQGIGQLVLIVDDLCDFWRQGAGGRARVGRR